jgi:hypothetical protein
MKKQMQKMIALACCMLLTVQLTDAQDIKRKWALSYTGTPWLQPVLTSNPSHKSTGRGFRAFSVTGDYLLPGKWRVEAGYFRSEVSYGDASRTMEGIQAGMKKYFVNPDFFIQPYLAASAGFNWGRHLEGQNEYDAYHRLKYAKNPYISIAPAVGTEIYLLSPLAFVVRYNLNIGLGSETIIGVKSPPENAYLLKDRGMFHQLELGLKITFPFRITDEEGGALLNIVREFFYNY